jgi:putative sigma-54 modulation protein
VYVGGGTLHADSIEENMYAAIDTLVDKLDRQIKKHKEKLTDHHAREVENQRYR